MTGSGSGQGPDNAAAQRAAFPAAPPRSPAFIVQLTAAVFAHKQSLSRGLEDSAVIAAAAK